MKDAELEFTGERFVPTLYNDNTIEHLHRYAFACKFIQDKIVLDMASGEGYGSNLMADYAAKVIGADISNESIEHAKKKYQKPNLSFFCSSAIELPIASNSVDVVVSFETIEHLLEQDEMLTEIKRVLKLGGFFIISSPDKEFYTDVTGHLNQFHLKELYFSELKNLLKKYFSYTHYYLQRIAYGSIICPENHTGDLQIFFGDSNSINDLRTINDGMYNIAICSDFDIDVSKMNSSFFDGTSILRANYSQLYNTLQYILNSRTYKLGRLLLAPKRLLSGFFKKRFR